jgi:Cyclic nucleotide-binding domain/Tetratricopeptide repeat
MSESVQEHINKRNYPKAIDLLKAQLKKQPRDQRVRLQLADVLVLGNRGKEAGPILMGLADEHAQDGFAAKAIAILKRIEKVEPGRRDVEERLAHLLKEKTRQAPSVTARPVAAAPAFELGLEEFDPTSNPMESAPIEASGDEPLLDVQVPEPEPEAAPEVEPVLEALPEIAADGVSDTAPVVEAEIDEDMAFVAAGEEQSPSSGDSMLSTPLFAGFSEQDLAAVIHGLELRTFEPGDILVAEGAPGDSLFILSTGSVKCFVRNPQGHYTRVHLLKEGDFFGEISVLTGKPRTATLVAAEYCEVLELGKTNLDSITATHPQVRKVLKDFHEQRAQSTIKAMLKSKR